MIGMNITSIKMVPIENQNKIEQIVSAIKKLIIEGDLKPGTSLPSERELAAQLGVSRFSLREALQVAKSHGLITVCRGRRPQVANPSSAAAAEIMSVTFERAKTSHLDLIEARECLECQIARLAAERADNIEIQILEDNLLQLEKYQEDMLRAAEIDVQFHQQLVKASRNVVFDIMLGPLAQLLRESRRRTMRADGVRRAIQGHKEILKAIKAHDSEGAARAMLEHLRMAKKDLDIVEKR